MTSLREEILSYLQLALLPEYDELDTITPEYTIEMCDNIITIFEKRILDRMDVVNERYAGFDTQYKIRKDELETVRQEMLK